jgi:hypothetical protein
MTLECGGMLFFFGIQKIVNFVDSLGNIITDTGSSVFRIQKQSILKMSSVAPLKAGQVTPV